MNSINWKTFGVGVICGLALGLAIGMGTLSERKARFTIVKIAGAFALKMDTQTGQTWQVKIGGNGASESEIKESPEKLSLPSAQ